MRPQRLKNVLFALIPPSTVLIVHLIRFHFRPDLSILDVVAHFLGGFSIAWMGWILMRGFRMSQDIPETTPFWLTNYCIFATVAVAGVFWEFYEWACDTFFGSMMQFTIPETMNDLLMDVLGGAVFLLIAHALSLYVKREGETKTR